MYPKFQRADELSQKVIGAAMEVHRHKGPGLLESIYEKCMLRELEFQRIPARNQRPVQVDYKGYVFVDRLNLDLIVDDCLIVEIKDVSKLLPNCSAT